MTVQVLGKDVTNVARLGGVAPDVQGLLSLIMKRNSHEKHLSQKALSFAKEIILTGSFKVRQPSISPKAVGKGRTLRKTI